MKRTEQELGRRVVAWLHERGWDVFQEVDCLGGVADIVARMGPRLWCVELKVGMSMAAIEQAMDRRRQFHMVSIAVFAGRHGRVSGRQLCAELGLGVIDVRTDWGEAVVRDTPPALRRRVASPPQLDPEHRTEVEAGAPCAAGRWTPWRRTCRAVEEWARANPGATFRELVKAVPHHYVSDASARSALRSQIERGVIPGVRIEGEGRALLVYPRGGA